MNKKRCFLCFYEYPKPPKMGIGIWTKRKYCSKLCSAFARRSTHMNADSKQWKGDNVGYHGIHKWIERKLGKPRLCTYCKTTEAKKFEWANISKEYKRDLSDWVRLCASCHRNYDKPWLKRTRDNYGRFV